MPYRNVVCTLVTWLLAAPALAQIVTAPKPAEGQLIPPPAWAFNDLACAPIIDTVVAGKAKTAPAIRVIGTQDTAIRQLMTPGDTLVVSGGSNAGLETGQRYFVRRLIREDIPTAEGATLPPSIHTAGWVQILGVDTMLATAAVLHACDGIMPDDFLEPFVAPMVADRPLPGTTPQYDNMGRIVTGYEGTRITTPGNLVTIDRGSNAGVVIGQRFLIFRDKRQSSGDTAGRSRVFAEMARRAPLVQIGEVLVVAVRPDDATVRIVASKDAIATGDLVAPVR